MSDFQEPTEDQPITNDAAPIEPETTDDIAEDEPEDLEALADEQSEEDGQEDQAENPDDAEAGEDEQQAEEWAEIVADDGQAYKVPAALKDGYMKDADYRRKTQAVSQEKQALEAKAAMVEQIGQTSAAEIQMRADMTAIYNNLQQYEQIDWAAYEEEDPAGAGSAFRQYTQMQQQLQNMTGELGKVQQQRTAQLEQLTNQRLAETAQWAQTNIPNWTPELDGKITQFAVEKLEHSLDTLKQVYNPNVYKTLHLAYIGQQTLDRSQQAKPQPNRPKAKPLSTVGAKSAPKSGRVEEIDDMEQYAAARKRQMGIPN